MVETVTLKEFLEFFTSTTTLNLGFVSEIK